MISDEYFSNNEIEVLDKINTMFEDYLKGLIVKGEIIDFELLKEKTTRKLDNFFIGYSKINKKIFGDVYTMFLELEEKTDKTIEHHYILKLSNEPVEVFYNENEIETIKSKLETIEKEVFENKVLLDKLLLHITGFINIDMKTIDERLSKILE